ncbi:MAG: hypothetical protein M3Q58_08870 [Bacteroidota bacterium]|nr:hypothetical protein [Bacteroidota bacterium]
MMKKRYIFLLFFIALAYYFIDYKRDFIHNKEKSEYITLWCRYGNCYVIPGKYYSPLPPKDNFIKTVFYRNYIGIIWKPQDNYKHKISFYNQYEEVNLDPNIKTYKKNTDLMFEYNILDSISSFNNENFYNDSADYYRKKYDYRYIDTGDLFGITSFYD